MFRSTLISLAVALCLSGATAADRAPNIVLILADDLGVNPVGAYGNSYAHTPVLDQLARDGLLFTTAYAASPVCSPTRATIMTGKAPARTHITDFISGNPYPYARLLQPKWRKSLPLKEVTLPEILRAHGYATALFGKWHLARGYLPPHSLAEGPDRQGFNETFITHKPNKDDDPEADAHGIRTITEKAIDFIGRHQEQPFFLFLAPNTIHSPIMAPAALVEKHRQRPGANEPENSPVIAAMMEQMDTSIGLILEKLAEAGLREHTLVIFASDNGGSLKDSTQSPLRGGKAQLYEGGVRVPLIMRWPGTITAGTTTDAPTSSADFFATVLAVTGAPVPETEPRDGVSLLPLMRGGRADSTRPLFWHYPHYHSAGVHGPASAIRQGDWKLIHYYERELTGQGTADELFNLREDPAETSNRISDEPVRAAELRAVLQQHLENAGAQIPTVNDNYDPARASE